MNCPECKGIVAGSVGAVVDPDKVTAVPFAATAPPDGAYCICLACLCLCMVENGNLRAIAQGEIVPHEVIAVAARLSQKRIDRHIYN
jgi:hypothetical protein